MARRAALSSPEPSDQEGDAATTPHLNERANNLGSPSPAASFSSDKENRGAASSRHTNGKARAMPPPSKLPTPESAEGPSQRASKRRRLSERDAPSTTQAAHEKRLETAGDTSVYDPDQSIEERRVIRKDYRDLSRELTDSRAEYLKPTSTGLVETLNKANALYGTVKQTSDATLDSRLLVSTADLSAKRTQQLNLGDVTQGIEVSDFISKCSGFMRRGDHVSQGTSSTQRRRRRADHDEDDSAGEGSADEGDEFNWEWLGRQACFPHNVRPPVPGFLLGPLSLQKRLRQPTQRRERLQRRDPRDAIRPEEVKAGGNEKAENNNLTVLCRQILELLVKAQDEGQEKVQEEAMEDMLEQDLYELMARHGLSEDGGVAFFRFVINPQSFGQTVENIFYTSFLIKEGSVGVQFDKFGLPTLHPAETSEQRKQRFQEQGIEPEPLERHQAVFHLDFETWEDLIEAFDLKKGIIPDRHTDEIPQVSATGWYG